MIQYILNRAADLVPSIRQLKKQRESALEQISTLSNRLRELEAQVSGRTFEAKIVPHAVIEQVLSAIRTEYTTLPRFAYHLPLDYEIQTLPPRFEEPVWVDGETLPLPPRVERHGHAADDAAYLEWGRYDHDTILSHIRRLLPTTDDLAVMDFGCSSGRVLRHFLTELREQGWKLTGVDVSARRIEWLRRNFPPEFRVYTGSILPVLPFESNSFDVIYGLSVFTHMKFLWDMWILELRRVLKPGGVLIQSIHTENAWSFFAQHSHEDWARGALGPMIIEQKQLPYDFVYYGNIGESQVFWKQKIAQEFWSRYLSDVKIYPPPERYSYQDWIIGRKADSRHTDPASLNGTVETKLNVGDAVSPSQLLRSGTSPATSAARRERAIFKAERDFSQYGEQKIILDFFSRVTSQFSTYCVDIGAYDGVIGSNSRALFLNGWAGAVVEPDPKTFARLRALYADRADITCVRKALSDQYRENVVMKFARGPANTAEEDKWKYAQVSTLHDYFAASYEKNFGYVYEPATVTTDTLNNVLRHVGAPRDLGFLTIDCEGEDLKIIKELDFDSFRPLLICVEADDNSRNLYSAVIEPKGYVLLSYTVANAFFALKNHSSG